METVRIKGDLVVLGNLICGNTGILEATGDVSWGWCLCKDQKNKALTRHLLIKVDEKQDLVQAVLNKGKTCLIYNCNYNIFDKVVRVEGDVYIWNDIIYNEETYQGRIVAGVDNM